MMLEVLHLLSDALIKHAKTDFAVMIYGIPILMTKAKLFLFEKHLKNTKRKQSKILRRRKNGKLKRKRKNGKLKRKRQNGKQRRKMKQKEIKKEKEKKKRKKNRNKIMI